MCLKTTYKKIMLTIVIVILNKINNHIEIAQIRVRQENIKLN